MEKRLAIINCKSKKLKHTFKYTSHNLIEL